VKTCGLFAGIGGIELGLERSGGRTQMVCEIDPQARGVLEQRFTGVTLRQDIRRMRQLPSVDLVAAGFPCQDLSQAGLRRGVAGERFQLVEHVFRLLEAARKPPTWLLLENVPFMLRLDRGAAMNLLARRLADGGWRWAYRTVDARAFGIPQRRRRVLLLASREEDPRPVLLGEDAGEPAAPIRPSAYGFYWTEGYRGLGLAHDAVPPLKGGFGLGIPSAPGVWFPDAPAGSAFGTPDIRDLERLQGLPEKWTQGPARGSPRQRAIADRSRWRLVGNAVCANVAEWVGERLIHGAADPVPESRAMKVGGWPPAGWGEANRRYETVVSTYPRCMSAVPLRDFLKHDLNPLSLRAASGFLSRAERSALTFPPRMLTAMREHIEVMRLTDAEAA
jgi:DNA (cytosine-5)-methyltransferase 1